MRTRLALVLLTLVSPSLAGTPFSDVAVQSRVGFDSNPVASGGTSATILGDRDTGVYAAGASCAIVRPAFKFTYAGEWVRYTRWAGENYSSHRLGYAAQATAGAWKLSADGSSLYVAGSRDTLLSLGTVNANAISLWRERREQWQHRLKVQAQHDTAATLLRVTGSLLAYDYLTKAVAGHVAFADRSDLQGGVDAGWKPDARSLWFAGLRAGRQLQAIVPLPNCNFDYANNYSRVVLGGEYRLPAGTTLAFAAGPDFRHYTGAIDPAILPRGRDRTSLWFEGSLTTKLGANWSLTGKTTRMAWLSSTGKSAYFDSCAEATLAWTPRANWNLRLSAKVHACDYFPVSRDDWESLVGLGLTRKISPRLAVTADLLRHQGWDTLAAAPERKFQRLVVNLGASGKL